MDKVSQVVVLVEDERHQRVVRQFLYRLGYRTDQLRFRPVPNSRGSGEQWVRDKYPGEVKECRRRQGRAATALVVVVDADERAVTDRLGQLNEALADSSLPARRADEPVALLVPKRNIETWVLCLSGHAVDEEANYKREPKIDGLINQAAAAFHDWSRRNAVVPQHCVDSLRQAIPEAQRIPPRNP